MIRDGAECGSSKASLLHLAAALACRQRIFLPDGAHRCGLDVPPFRLAEDGLALVLDRFELLIYDDVQGEARLAPVYDVLTTSLYLPKDSRALTLNGTTQWPSAKELRRRDETRAVG